MTGRLKMSTCPSPKVDTWCAVIPVSFRISFLFIGTLDFKNLFLMMFGPKPLSIRNFKEPFKSLLSSLTVGTSSVRVRFIVRYPYRMLSLSLEQGVCLYFPESPLSSREFLRFPALGYYEPDC